MVMTRSSRSVTGDVMANTGTVQPVPWQKRDLTNRIAQYPGENHLLHSEVDEAIARAFQVWGDVTCLLTCLLNKRIVQEYLSENSS